MFSKKIKNRKFTVGVIGLGYVGLPRVLQFCESKIKVIGFDIDKEKISKLKKGESYLSNVSPEKIKEALNKNFFIPTHNFQNICYVVKR